MLKADHVGYAVKRIEKAISEMELLGFQFEDIVCKGF